MNRRLVLALCTLCALSGCGSVRELQPKMGHSLPPAPYGQSTKPTTAELLAPPLQTEPVRSEELRRQSEQRADDPFDLPPEDKPRS